MKRKLYLVILIGMFWIVNRGEALSQQMDHLHSLALDPQTGTLLMGTHNGFYESRDEGKSWQKRTLKGDAPGTDFMTMVVEPANPTIIYAGGHDLAVVKSADGGMNWQRAGKGLPTTDIHALAVDPKNSKRLYAWVVGSGLYRSDDGAASWSRVDDGPENPNVTSLVSVPIPTGMGGIFLYAGTAAGLFRGPDCF